MRWRRVSKGCYCNFYVRDGVGKKTYRTKADRDRHFIVQCQFAAVGLAPIAFCKFGRLSYLTEIVEPFRSWACQNANDSDWESDYTWEYARLRVLLARATKAAKLPKMELHPGNIGLRYGSPCILDFS